MLSNSPQAVFGHGYEGLCLHAGAEDVLDAPQEVIGPQNEHQLSWDCV